MPIVILAAGIGIMFALSSMKKPPEEKAKVDNTPIVAIEAITLAPMTLNVNSYGIVKPKYETELVSQVSGQVVELSNAFVRGGFVKKGQLLARIDPSDYEAALMDAQANLASAKAAFKTEMAQGKVAETEWKHITDAAPTELSLRKPQLAQELARVKAAQAAVLRAKRNMERTEIVAPYDAMIDSRNIGLGSFVAMGSPIGKVLSTDVAEIRLPVADNQLKFLQDHGQNAEVILHAEFAGEEQQWQATIARNEGVIDNKSRMNYLVASINDPYNLNKSRQNILQFGAYVKADIQGKYLNNATLIPRHLVIDGKVALFDKNAKLHFAPVNIVRQQGANVVVSEGLLQGDQLIVSALDYPVDGMKLALLSDENETQPEDNNPMDKPADATEVASTEE
jgi:RND family efflux transporter MFP subunit